MKNTRSADFCADRIDVIANFAVITNVVIKRIHLKKLHKMLNIQNVFPKHIRGLLSSVGHNLKLHNHDFKILKCFILGKYQLIYLCAKFFVKKLYY